MGMRCEEEKLEEMGTREQRRKRILKMERERHKEGKNWNEKQNGGKIKKAKKKKVLMERKSLKKKWRNWRRDRREE